MVPTSAQTPILKVNKMKKYFQQRAYFGKTGNWLRAVDGVSFSIQAGRPWDWLASGCGKTTVDAP